MARFTHKNQTTTNGSTNSIDNFGLVTADDFVNFDPNYKPVADSKVRMAGRPKFAAILLLVVFAGILAVGAYAVKQKVKVGTSLADQYFEFGVFRGKEDSDHHVHQAADVDDPATALNYLEGNVIWRADNDNQRDYKRRMIALTDAEQKEYLKQFAKGYKVGYLQYQH